MNFRQVVHDERNPQPKIFKYLFSLSVMPAVFSGHPVGDFESLDFADDILLTTPIGLRRVNDSGMEKIQKVQKARQGLAVLNRSN